MKIPLFFRGPVGWLVIWLAVGPFFLIAAAMGHANDLMFYMSITALLFIIVIGYGAFRILRKMGMSAAQIVNVGAQTARTVHNQMHYGGGSGNGGSSGSGMSHKFHGEE